MFGPAESQAIKYVFKYTVRHAALGVQVLGQRQQQLTETLIVRLLKTHLFSLFQKLEGLLAPPGPLHISPD